MTDRSLLPSAARWDGSTAAWRSSLAPGVPPGSGSPWPGCSGREGAKVAITSTTDRIHGRASRLETDGVEAAAFVADLTDESQANVLVEAVTARFGAIDVLVNNAGMVQTGVDDEGRRFVDIGAASVRARSGAEPVDGLPRHESRPARRCSNAGTAGS